MAVALQTFQRNRLKPVFSYIFRQIALLACISVKNFPSLQAISNSAAFGVT